MDGVLLVLDRTGRAIAELERANAQLEQVNAQLRARIEQLESESANAGSAVRPAPG